MRILCIADEELMEFWDYYVSGRLKEYDLILSSGDLKAAYLSFVVTMARAPVLYVHGNHDTGYAVTEPEGCDSIDGKIVEYRGLRILGLGGCVWYRPGDHQYTQKEMAKRLRRLRWEIAKYGGVDIVVTHAPPEGVGDSDDMAHRGFRSFLGLNLALHPPKFLLKQKAALHDIYHFLPLPVHVSRFLTEEILKYLRLLHIRQLPL